ncbi:MAG: hypothetical protein PWQ27_1793 [Kosmotoga sp.]|nr:hypothetical protein [Kosmotoga sp.]
MRLVSTLRVGKHCYALGTNPFGIVTNSFGVVPNHYVVVSNRKRLTRTPGKNRDPRVREKTRRLQRLSAGGATFED